MKHKKKATRRIKIKKPKGGAELPAASSMSSPDASSVSPDASSIPLAASSVSPDASSVSPDAYSATSEPDNSKQSFFQKIKNIPGANWWKNLKMPWSGGKKHKKKRSLKRNTKKRN